MLEYTKAGDGARLSMREYAYGPAQDLPNTKVGTSTQALYDAARKDGEAILMVVSKKCV